MSAADQVVNSIKQNPVQVAVPRQPVLRDDPEGGMSFGGYWDLSRASNNPELQRQIVAEAKGVPVENVTFEQGQLAYVDKDGKQKLAEPSDDDIQQLFASFLAKPGAMVGGAVGGGLGATRGGPAATAMASGGAAVGDLIQSGIEQAVSGQDRTAAEIAGSAATEGALAGAGEAAFRGGRALWKNLTRGVDARIPEEQLNEAWALVQRARERGIDLTPAEALGNRDMLNVQTWLQDVPGTGGQMGDFASNRAGQVDRAIENYIGTDSPHTAYTKGINAVGKARDAMVQARSEAASPYYEAAATRIADIQPLAERMSGRMKELEGTKIGNSLKRAHRAITRMDGDERIPKELIGELHMAKVDIDDMIEEAARNGRGGAVKELTEVKNDLLNIIEGASDDYRLARETFRDMSGPINTFDESVTGAMVREGERHSPNLGRVLFGPTSSPEQVAYARRTMDNPEAWNDVVQGYLRQSFEEIADSQVDDVVNTGGIFYKKVFGTEAKRNKLKAALPGEQYEALEDMMTILRATGRGFKGNSITAQRQLMNERATPEGIKLWSAAHKAYTQAGFDRTADNLANMLTNPYNRQQLSKVAKEIRKFGMSDKALEESAALRIGGALAPALTTGTTNLGD